ncbi:MAG TPA: SpoIID/LytB domain-containing protein [Candidatus Limnocylindria bacterium]|nr:SpoIID/LytB domain-containing protein [Candidatus Limnocylindria bacterium]
MPLHAAPERAAPRLARSRARGASVVTALITAVLLLGLTTTGTLAATTMTPKCDAVNLRKGPSTTYAKKTMVNRGAKITVVSTVSGGSYWTSCNGKSLSGSSWHKISAINGKSVSSLYGVSYLYGASKLFKTVVTPTAAPTAPPTPTVAPAATEAPTPVPSPTADPGATQDPLATPEPTTTPAPPTPTPTITPDPTATPGPVTLPASITFYGRGYGHGVGLSQYGAHGRALDGQSAAEILAHYYQGTTLGTKTNSQVRVKVLHAFKATSTNPVQVYGRGGTWSIDGVAKVFPAGARLRFTPTVSGTTTTWRVLVTATDGTTLHSASSSNSIRVRPAAGSSATLQLWSKPSAYDRYRGVLRLIGKKNGTSTVKAINLLDMESYLKGVVPAEVPSTWPVEAVRAQAIAARSYAYYRLHPTTGAFDIYDDTRSQVYRGYLAEKAGATAAINATANVVVRTSGGGIANTLFHSAGGGATEHNENVFVSSTGGKVAGVYSYLRGSMDRRADGSAFDVASPYDTWKTKTYTLAQIQAWFAADSRSNVGTLVALDLQHRGVSGRLISVTLIGADGATKKVSGDVFRSIFNANRPTGDAMMRTSLFDLAPIP